MRFADEVPEKGEPYKDNETMKFLRQTGIGVQYFRDHHRGLMEI
jgi:hypothetical protein